MKRKASDTPRSVNLGFENDCVTLSVDAILPLRALGESAKSSRKYRQIVASIGQIGIVEPPVVVRNPDKSATWLLLDGHLRIEALKDAGAREVECLVSTDDEAFTYNRQVSRLAPIQEHRMIRKAIERGVPEEKIALALDLNMSSIRRKVRLLDGICEEAVAILKDKPATGAVFQTLRKMNTMRQIDPDPLSAGTAGDAGLWAGSSAAVGMAANPLGAHQAGSSFRRLRGRVCGCVSFGACRRSGYSGTPI